MLETINFNYSRLHHESIGSDISTNIQCARKNLTLDSTVYFLLLTCSFLFFLEIFSKDHVVSQHGNPIMNTVSVSCNF